MESHGRLNSWKEISAYLGKSVRTVQRWEKELGLPIHRLPGGDRDIVFGYAGELEEWLRTHSALVEKNHVGEPSHAVADGATQKPGPMRATWPRRVGIAAGVAVLLAGMAYGGWLLWVRATGQPAEFEVRGNTLAVFDGAKHRLWEYAFAAPLNEATYRETPGTIPEGLYTRAEDLDGDGKAEFLFLAWPAKFGEPNVLYCFDHRGRVKWSYEPQRTLHFGEKEYGPPFSVDFFQVFEDEATHGKSVWAVAHQVPWFPSAVVKLDASGNVLGEYWHPGHIKVIAEGRVAGRQVVLAGATHNELYSATLAVLDFAHPEGSAPATDKEHRCGNCPVGEALAYLVFPRSPVSRALESRPTVEQIRMREDGNIEITVVSAVAPSGTKAAESYSFDGNLRLRSAEVQESYAVVHAELREKKILREPLGRRGEAEFLSHVRYWDGKEFAKGWAGLSTK